MKLVVIDYGLSNLLSVCRSFAFLGCEPVVSSSPEEVLAADALVLLKKPHRASYWLASVRFTHMLTVKPVSPSAP